jgi:hypothetical protein
MYGVIDMTNDREIVLMLLKRYRLARKIRKSCFDMSCERFREIYIATETEAGNAYIAARRIITIKEITK